MGKIYFDTTPIIYFLDDEKPFSDKVAKFIYERQDNVFITSTITDSEYLVFPYRTQNLSKIQKYEIFLHDFAFQMIVPNRAIAKQAAKIRAEFLGIKGMDALHLATSAFLGCDCFLTNDARLKQATDLKILLVDEL